MCINMDGGGRALRRLHSTHLEGRLEVNEVLFLYKLIRNERLQLTCPSTVLQFLPSFVAINNVLELISCAMNYNQGIGHGQFRT